MCEQQYITIKENSSKIQNLENTINDQKIDLNKKTETILKQGTEIVSLKNTKDSLTAEINDIKKEINLMPFLDSNCNYLNANLTNKIIILRDVSNNLFGVITALNLKNFDPKTDDSIELLISKLGKNSEIVKSICNQTKIICNDKNIDLNQDTTKHI